jgi:hypothetical protein
MDEKTQEGYLVLADISGYTSFLTQAELDHAGEIITELLELITDRFESLLTISKLEGDAVFAYLPANRISRGETVVDLLESTYVAFRNRIQSSKRLTTCTCRGCKAMPTLDLKFIVHHGQFAFQEIAGHRDLVGNDVIVVHRLLKNRVSDVTGWKAYALFTRQALEHMAMSSDEMVCVQESYEHLGTVDTFAMDFRKRYDELSAARRVQIVPEEAHVMLRVELPLPPVAAWEWINDPKKRTQWSGSEVRPLLRPGGRLKEGAQNHCIHGKSMSVEDVLDWRPFDYVTVDVKTPMGSIRTTYALSETPNGSLLEDRSQFIPQFFLLKPFGKQMLKLMYAMIKPEQTYQNLVRAIEEEKRSSTPTDSPADTPSPTWA